MYVYLRVKLSEIIYEEGLAQFESYYAKCFFICLTLSMCGAGLSTFRLMYIHSTK